MPIAERKYLARSQQERRASSIALLHLLLHGAGALQGLGDKGLGSTASQQRDRKSQAAFRALLDQYLHAGRIYLHSQFEGILLKVQGRHSNMMWLVTLWP